MTRAEFFRKRAEMHYLKDNQVTVCEPGAAGGSQPFNRGPRVQRGQRGRGKHMPSVRPLMPDHRPYNQRILTAPEPEVLNE